MTTSRIRSRTSYYISGVLTGYLTSAAQILTGLFLAPLTLQFISSEAYGITAVVQSLVLWTDIATLGFPAWLSLHLAQNANRDADETEMNKSISTVFFMQLVACLLVLAAGLILSTRFTDVFQTSQYLRYDAQGLIALTTGIVIVSLLMQTFQMILIAHQQMYFDNLVEGIFVIFRFLLAVFLLHLGFGIQAAMLAILVVGLIRTSVIVRRAYRILPNLDIRLKSISFPKIPEIFRLSAWWTLAYVAGILIENTDQTVAGLIVNLEAVTVMVLTGRLYTLTYSLLFRLTKTARPGLGALIGQNNMESAERNYHQLLVVSTALAALGAAAIWAGNEAFINAWVGQHLYGGELLSAAFAINLVVNSWMQPHISLLNAAMIARPQTIIRLIEASVNLALSFWLGSQFGITGIILATGIAGMFTSLFLLPYQIARLLNKPYRTTITEELGLVVRLTLLIPIAILMKIIANHFGGFVGAIIGATLTCFLGLIVLWWVVFDNDIRDRIWSLLRQVKQKLIAA